MFISSNQYLNDSPRIGQNKKDREAHAKPRLGCVSSSSSDIRRRSIYEINE